jgi:hypothetical protein
VSIRDTEAGWDKGSSGNEEAFEEGVNNINFNDSVMIAYCHTLQQQRQLLEYSNNPGKRAVHQFLVKELK